MDSGDESDHDPISTEMLEDIFDGSQYHPNVNRIEARYKTRDRIKQRKLEQKGALKATRNMGKGLHKLFKTDAKEISQDFPSLGETGIIYVTTIFRSDGYVSVCDIYTLCYIFEGKNLRYNHVCTV